MIKQLGQLPNVILLLSIVLVLYYTNNGQLFDAIANKILKVMMKNLHIRKILQQVYNIDNNEDDVDDDTLYKKQNQINYFNYRTDVGYGTGNYIEGPNVDVSNANNIMMHEIKDKDFNNIVNINTPLTESYPGYIQENKQKEGDCNVDTEWGKLIDITKTEFVQNEAKRVPVYNDPIVSESSRVNDNLERLNAVMNAPTNDYNGTIEDLYDEIVSGK